MYLQHCSLSSFFFVLFYSLYAWHSRCTYTYVCVCVCVCVFRVYAWYATCFICIIWEEMRFPWHFSPLLSSFLFRVFWLLIFFSSLISAKPRIFFFIHTLKKLVLRGLLSVSFYSFLLFLLFRQNDGVVLMESLGFFVRYQSSRVIIGNDDRGEGVNSLVTCDFTIDSTNIELDWLDLRAQLLLFLRKKVLVELIRCTESIYQPLGRYY